MKCPSCNSKLKGDVAICYRCGNSFITSGEAIHQEITNTYKYIKAYIGQNSYHLLNGSFSFCTFFGGGFYLLYRKTWFLVLLYYLGLFFINFVSGTIIYLVMLIYHLIYGLIFKRFYLSSVTKKVEKILKKNDLISEEKKLTILRKKGGVSFIALIIGVIINIVIIAIILASIN